MNCLRKPQRDVDARIGRSGVRVLRYAAFVPLIALGGCQDLIAIIGQSFF